MPKQTQFTPPCVFPHPNWEWTFRAGNGDLRYGIVSESINITNANGESVDRQDGLVVPTEFLHYLTHRHRQATDCQLEIQIIGRRAYLAYVIDERDRYYLFYWTAGTIPNLLKPLLT